MDGLTGYSVWGAVATEVEVDVLTGQVGVVRCDLLQDTGTSLSPAVDVGQLEGGLALGFGLWSCEQLRFVAKTGVQNGKQILSLRCVHQLVICPSIW